MTLPIAVPDWLPWWAAVAILVPILLYLLAFLVMPFSTFGVKGRLDLVEARLDEIQGEIRSLALRLPDRGSGNHASVAGGESHPPVPPRRTDGPLKPDQPIEWAGSHPAAPDARDEADAPRRAPRHSPTRSEPRLDWPR